MATPQNGDEKNRKKYRRLTEVRLELDDLRQRREVIIAKHTKDVWSDASLDKVEYNARPKLREAELTLRLEVDPEYQDTRKRERELLLELGDLEYDLGLSLYENDSDLDNL